MNNEKTGELIRALRTEKGITQKQLAERLNISNATVSKWETGHGFPDVSLLEPLSDALGITVTELVSGCRTEQNTCGADPAKDVLDLSRKEQNHSDLKTAALIGFILLVCAVGFVMIVNISPLRTLSPYLTSTKGSISINILAIGLGLASWGCGIVGIIDRQRRQSYTIASFSLCCISLWLPLLLMTGYSRTEDTIMFLDTMGGYNFGAMVLLFVTMVLNGASAIFHRNQQP